VIGVVAAVGVGGGIKAIGDVRDKKKPAYHLEKAPVQRGTVVGKVTATGTLAALVTVQVGSQISGRIQELAADFGSTVKKGQVIAKLDAQLYAAASEQARANRDAARGNLAQARAKMANADKQYQRAQELAGKNLIPPSELDARMADAEAARAAVAAAQGDLEQARAAYHQANVNLGYTTIVSPISGIVISRNVDVGQTVAASLQAPTLYTIAEDLRQMQVHAAVSEADVGKLAAGMRATFTVDAYPQERFEGKISQIRDAPQTVQNVVTYDAVIQVDNTAMKLKPGMTANVTFIYANRKDVLRVPTAALRFRPPAELLSGVKIKGKGKGKDKDKGRDATAADGVPAIAPRTVWVLRDGAPVEVPVTVGVADGSHVEVESPDLAEGDVVITDAIGRAERAEGKRLKAQAGGTTKAFF